MPRPFFTDKKEDFFYFKYFTFDKKVHASSKWYHALQRTLARIKCVLKINDFV